MKKNQLPAEKAYDIAMKEVELKLEMFKRHLAAHKKAHAKDPANWGFVGDLNRYAADLDRLVD